MSTKSGSFRIPAIYLNDWPDRYIHTNFDALPISIPRNSSAPPLSARASGYFLANLGQNDVTPVIQQIEADALRRTATTLQRRDELQAENDALDATTLLGNSLTFESDTFASIQRFQPLTAEQEGVSNRFVSDLAHTTGLGGVAGDMMGDQVVVFSRSAEPKGVMAVFGYDYFADHYGASRARSLKVSSYEGLRGSGEDYAYEILNFVDGKRNAQQIRDAVSAEYGPIPFAYVIEYLRALESIGILRVAK